MSYINQLCFLDVYLNFGYLNFILTVAFRIMVWIMKFEWNMLCMDV